MVFTDQGMRGWRAALWKGLPREVVPAPNLTVQEAFGQSSVTCGVSLGVSCALDDPDGCLPAQHIPWLCDFKEDS